MLCLRTASHAYKEYLQTDYDTGSVQKMAQAYPGITPYVYFLFFTLFSVRFSEVLDSCTVQRHQMVDGSTSKVL